MNNYQNHPLYGAADLDSAMTKLWAFYKKYFIGLYIISLLMAVLNGILSSGFDLSPFYSMDTTDYDEVFKMMKTMIVPYSLMVVISVVFGILLHAWVLERPLGQENTLLKVLKSGLISLVPFILVVIVFAVIGTMLTSIGILLLVLPGVFAMLYIVTVALFALPVMLTESRNPMQVISRSFSLAHSHFWPNMAWVVVVGLIIVVISLVVSGLVMLPFTGTFIKALGDPDNAAKMLEMTKNPFYIGLSALASSLVTPVFPILAFLLYFRNSEGMQAVEVTPEDDNRVKVEDLYPKMPDNK